MIIDKKGQMNKIFEKQIWHFLFLVISFIIFYFIFPLGNLLNGKFYFSTFQWSLIHLSFVLTMHIGVLISWRLELHYKYMTKIFGNKAFLVHRIIFFFLFLGRFVSIGLLAFSSRDTLDVDRSILLILIVVFSIFLVYLVYSIIKYFGFSRASGADHFEPEYRDKPFVKGGIYKYTSNGMYFFGMLVFWLPGLVHASSIALILAFFSHCYIWVHYFTIEKPDWKWIYADLRG